MKYPFKCETHGEVEVICSIHDIKSEMPCPICELPSTRIFTSFQIAGKSTNRKLKKIDTSKDWITRHQKDKWI